MIQGALVGLSVLVLVVTLLLLILIGDALRDALDPRKVLQEDEA